MQRDEITGGTSGKTGAQMNTIRGGYSKCRDNIGIRLWNLNACTLSKNDLSQLFFSFSDTCDWDILTIHKGIKNMTPGTSTQDGYHIITGETGDTGAPHIVLNHRLGTRLRRTILHANYVIAEVGMIPPLLIFSLYLPAFSNRGSASFAQTMQTFHDDLQETQRRSPIVPSTFVDIGYTRQPWQGQRHKQQPSTIDFLFTSQKLHTTVHNNIHPQPATTTDHKPIGMTCHAPYGSRMERRRIFEHLLAQNHGPRRRIPTTWQPARQGQFARQVRDMTFDSIQDLGQNLVEIAANHTAQATEATEKKQDLLQAIRQAPDQITKKAYQITLQSFRRQQREQKEKHQLIEWAKGKSWTLNKQIKIPGTLHYPSQLNQQEDRGVWGETLGTYLAQLYATSPQDRQDIHEHLWHILQDAQNSKEPAMECHANELRDIIKATLAQKAPGPDGIPSQLLRALPYHHIKFLAQMFTEMSNDIDYNTIKRPENWRKAIAVMIPKKSQAQELDQHRTITLINQAQKTYSKWLMTQVQERLDAAISEHQLGFRNKDKLQKRFSSSTACLSYQGSGNDKSPLSV